MSLDAVSEAAVHSLLARILLTEMDRSAIDSLCRDEVVDTLEQLRPGCARYLRDTAWDEASLDALAADYCTLFLLPKGVAPFAASWLDGDPAIARAELTERINEVLDALQVRPADFGMGNMPADHIGVLLALHALALQQGGRQLAARSQALLTPWAEDFAARLTDHAARIEAPLYEAAGRLLTETLRRM